MVFFWVEFWIPFFIVVVLGMVSFFLSPHSVFFLVFLPSPLRKMYLHENKFLLDITKDSCILKFATNNSRRRITSQRRTSLVRNMMRVYRVYANYDFVLYDSKYNKLGFLCFVIHVFTFLTYRKTSKHFQCNQPF